MFAFKAIYTSFLPGNVPTTLLKRVKLQGLWHRLKLKGDRECCLGNTSQGESRGLFQDKTSVRKGMEILTKISKNFITGQAYLMNKHPRVTQMHWSPVQIRGTEASGERISKVWAKFGGSTGDLMTLTDDYIIRCSVGRRKKIASKVRAILYIRRDYQQLVTGCHMQC